MKPSQAFDMMDVSILKGASPVEEKLSGKSEPQAQRSSQGSPCGCDIGKHLHRSGQPRPATPRRGGTLFDFNPHQPAPPLTHNHRRRFIAVGATGLVFGFWTSTTRPPHAGAARPGLRHGVAVGRDSRRGVPALRRPLGALDLVAWLAFHVVLGAFHSLVQFAVHAVLMAIVCFFLFRPERSLTWRPQRSGKWSSSATTIQRDRTRAKTPLLSASIELR